MPTYTITDWPRRLSDTLEEALMDLSACDASPEYEAYPNTWHFPDIDTRCLVCLAGARMRLGPNIQALPRDFDSRSCNIFCALDLLRHGLIGEAVNRWATAWALDHQPTLSAYRTPCEILCSPAWYLDMREIVVMLREIEDEHYADHCAPSLGVPDDEAGGGGCVPCAVRRCEVSDTTPPMSVLKRHWPTLGTTKPPHVELRYVVNAGPSRPGDEMHWGAIT